MRALGSMKVLTLAELQELAEQPGGIRDLRKYRGLLRAAVDLQPVNSPELEKTIHNIGVALEEIDA